MPKENLTCITAVLDRSGSMSLTQKDVIGGFNSFLKEQKETPGEALFTLAMFDHAYDLVYDCVPISDVKDLDEKTYYARGNTSLLDAIGRTINAVGSKLASMNEEDRPSKVLFLIMTDGEENASREFKHSKIMEMINHQRDAYKWNFVFIGANQDAIKAGSSMGFSANQSYNYAASSVGTKSAYSSMSAGTRRFRLTHDVDEAFSMPDPLAVVDNNATTTNDSTETI